MPARYTEAAVQVSRQVSWFKLEERDQKNKSTKVDAGDFKHELLNQLRSTMLVKVLNNAMIMGNGSESMSIPNVNHCGSVLTIFKSCCVQLIKKPELRAI